jgi:lysophospholipase L1-like esterase
MRAIGKRSLLARLALCACGLVLGLGTAEVLLRVLHPPVAYHPLPIRSVDAPYLYGLDPADPRISPQGLRETREFAIPRPPTAQRVLMLGDSVVYGEGVQPHQTLPARLEARLRARGIPVEVINAGTPGWSPYNERQYYTAAGRAFGAQVVVVVFCLNDVADPHLHWRLSRRRLLAIPDEAVPNLDYHRTHAPQELAARDAQQRRREGLPWRLLQGSVLYQELEREFRTGTKRPVRKIGGNRWPLYLTDGSPTIDVLMDPDSAEWRWLRAQYRALNGAVREEGARLVVASVPLAYQLDTEYPYLPQKLLAGFCEELGVAYVPGLPVLRGRDAGELYLGHRSGYDDIWHLSASGLDLVAANLADVLARDPALAGTRPTAGSAPDGPASAAGTPR